MHYGYKRIYIYLRREGWMINHKRVYRLYCQEGLQLRRKSPNAGWRQSGATTVFRLRARMTSGRWIL